MVRHFPLLQIPVTCSKQQRSGVYSYYALVSIPMSFRCSGESSSSSGSDVLTDPLERMALDVGMLDRQYRKLMDRQKQTHIVVGGTYILLHL